MGILIFRKLKNVTIYGNSIQSSHPFIVKQDKNVLVLEGHEEGLKTYKYDFNEVSEIEIERCANILIENFKIPNLEKITISELSRLHLNKFSFNDLTIILNNASVLIFENIKCGVISLSMKNSVFIKDTVAFKKIVKVAVDAKSKIIDRD